MTLAVVSYDIVDDTRRNKVAKVLLDYGERVQYSVFEITFVDMIPEIKEKISSLINTEEDNVRYYLLCRGCVNKKAVIGQEKSICGDSDCLIF